MEKFDKIVSMGTVPSETNSKNSNFYCIYSKKFVTIHHKKFTENRHYPLFIEIQM